MRVDDENAARFFRLPQRPNRDQRLLTQKLLRRFDLLMGTTSTEGEEIVGGVSEIFELKGRNWQIRKEEGTILSQARWRRQHALTACRIRADSKDA
ncbi:hypothetical protein FRC17_001126 [Serendipita sp. 399]|nr:hypothetical protein FRC17_001126 [Serendipita sp. 399]